MTDDFSHFRIVICLTDSPRRLGTDENNWFADEPRPTTWSMRAAQEVEHTEKT